MGTKKLKNKKWLLIFAWIIVIALCGYEIPIIRMQLSSELVGTDFIAYWASARLMLTGENPYDSEKILSLQKSKGWTGENPLVMYNHPWALAFILPFAWENYELAKFIWLCFLFLLLTLCADWIWHIYGGTKEKRLWSLFLLYSFAPTIFMLAKGQIVPFVLLGLTGFLYFEKRQQYFSAGVCSGLIAIKPHIAILFWIALLLWVIDRRRWSVIAGCLLAGVCLTIIPLCYNPQILSFYFERILIGHSPYLLWLTPTIGTYLRILIGWKIYWLQFIPTIFGGLFFVSYYRRREKTWVWERELPIIISLSLLTTFYVWVNDYAIFILVIIQSAIWMERTYVTATFLKTLIAVFIVINVLSWAIYILIRNEQWMIWLIPSFHTLYVLLLKHVSKTNRCFSSPSIVKCN